MAKGPGTKFTGKGGGRVLWDGPKGLRPFPEGTPKPGGKGCASMILLAAAVVSLVILVAVQCF